MSRLRVAIDDGRELVFGWDQPFRTYFVQLWDTAFDPDFAWGAPAKAAGYHEMEKVAPLAGEYGAYPLADLDAVRGVMEGWGLSGEVIEQVVAQLLAEKL